MTDTPAAETFEARISALAPLTHYGPNYNRGAADALGDARLFQSRGESDAAEHYLLVAEARAERISFDEFEARDPFARVRVTVTDGDPAWVSDGPGAVEQRDRVRAAMLNSGLAWPLKRVEIRHSHGASDDLSIALGLLVAVGEMPAMDSWPKGSLELDGSIRDETGFGKGTLRGVYERYRK